MKERKKTPGERISPGAKGIAAAPGAGARRDGVGPRKPDEMSPDLMEFLQAVDDYRTREGRPFPTWSEIFQILIALGYRRVTRPTQGAPGPRATGAA
jgi:hypothetical protein